MTAKKYLSKIYIVDYHINNVLVCQKDDLRATLYKIGLASGNDGNRVKSSSDPDRISSTVAKLDEVERQITAEIDRLVDLKVKISNEIKALAGIGDIGVKYVAVLMHYYVFLETWAEVSARLNYNERYCRQLRDEAVIEFEHMYADMLQRL